MSAPVLPAVRARDFVERCVREGWSLASPGLLAALGREFSEVEREGARRARPLPTPKSRPVAVAAPAAPRQRGASPAQRKWRGGIL